MKHLKIATGFSLIELVIFIVIIGLVVAGIMVPLNVANEKSPTDFYVSQATQLARERMELILGQRHFQGFTNFIDPCTSGSPPADCTFTGYTISSSIVATTIRSDTDYKLVTVTVTGLSNATLTYLVGEY